MQELGVDPEDAETFVFVSDGQAFTKSDAALKIAQHLRGGWRSLRFFRFVPRPVRNWVYVVFARNRYRWFGRYEQCMVPSAEISERFVID